MNRFSGTIVPAPSQICRLKTCDKSTKYIVSWFNDEKFYTNVFLAIENSRVFVEHVYSCRNDNDVAEELFVQSAILNVKAMLK